MRKMFKQMGKGSMMRKHEDAGVSPASESKILRICSYWPTRWFLGSIAADPNDDCNKEEQSGASACPRKWP